MRRINVRAFRQNLSKELKDLPFILTLNGRDIAVVSTPESAVLPRAGYRESDGVSFGGSVRPNPKPGR